MDEQKIEALVTAFLAPLRDVGELLARQIDEANARMDALFALLEETRIRVAQLERP